MIIKDLITGNFMERPNRFTVLFIMDDKIENAHLRDPGRLKELLIPGISLLLRKAKNTAKRKTKYDVIAVLNEDIWVLINSGFHSDIAAELIETRLVDEFKWYNIEKREYNYGKSRLDFLLSNNNVTMLLEVKGCTLVENGLAKFPDAPTTRGKRHLEELMLAKSEGLNAAVLFLIMREDAIEFTPNWETDPDFSATLIDAYKKDVEVVAYSFKNIYKNDFLNINPFKRINIKL
ncbi:MAG: DNA/RNA nuclease SfsA [Methanobacterium sp.]|jgi:sugar fermentation stimulation protein A